jgi:tRNA threonylcarbamoyladenosine biosynthesis protein TsaE
MTAREDRRRCAWAPRTAEETEAVGAELARRRPPRRDGIAVVYLTGDLGAGKTTLARGILHALGIPGTVHSPSYNLMDVYDTKSGPVVHLDLYRMRDPSELESLGLRDEARPGALWLVEWPERGEGWLPPADIVITLAVRSDSHSITAEARTDYGRRWLT